MNDILVENPSYDLAVDITDNKSAEFFAPLVAHLCQLHHIEFKQYSQISGWGNLLFDIDNQLIIKVSAPNWALQSNREIEALTLLKGHQLNVAIPQLLHHGEINGWVYFITDKLPGNNLHELWKTLDFDTRHRLMSQIGAFAKSLNELPVAPTGMLAVDWPEFITTQSAGAYAKRKKQGLTGALLDDINPFITTVNYQGRQDQARLIHCDLHAGNLLAQQVNGQWQLSGVIDFGDAIISNDINYEMTATMILMGLGDKKLNHAFLTGYGREIENIEAFQQALMVLSLIRHSGEMGYVLSQVEDCQQMDNWQSVAGKFFAL